MSSLVVVKSRFVGVPALADDDDAMLVALKNNVEQLTGVIGDGSTKALLPADIDGALMQARLAVPSGVLVHLANVKPLPLGWVDTAFASTIAGARVIQKQ